MQGNWAWLPAKEIRRLTMHNGVTNKPILDLCLPELNEFSEVRHVPWLHPLLIYCIFADGVSIGYTGMGPTCL